MMSNGKNSIKVQGKPIDFAENAFTIGAIHPIEICKYFWFKFDLITHY